MVANLEQLRVKVSAIHFARLHRQTLAVGARRAEPKAGRRLAVLEMIKVSSSVVVIRDSVAYLIVIVVGAGRLSQRVDADAAVVDQELVR